MEEKIEEILGKIKSLPNKPGVYLMKDVKSKVLYIGKSKQLKTRLLSYFTFKDNRYQIPFLLQKVNDIETIATFTEREALSLEAELIHKYKPKYNIRLKDDKSYVKVRIDYSAQWPRIEIVRKVRSDGAKYLGPFVFSNELYTLLESVRRTIPLRTCSDSVLSNRTRPCLEYQLKNCLGPCCLDVDRDIYIKYLRQAEKILSGNLKDAIKEITVNMEEASSELNFEYAAKLRDQLVTLEKISEGGVVGSYSPRMSKDALGIFSSEGNSVISLTKIRRGQIQETKVFEIDQTGLPYSELISSAISYYYRTSEDLPSQIIIPIEIEDSKELEEYFLETKGSSLKIVVAKAGDNLRLVNLANDSARENLNFRYGKGIDSLASTELMRELSLEQEPRVIDCIDISHLQGTNTVGSVVRFKDASPEKEKYRLYKLSVDMNDDFASMREVLARHLSRGQEEHDLPDLLVVDGGKAQLSQGLAIMKELSISTVDIISLAKKRSEKKFYSSSISSSRSVKKPERVFSPGVSEPYVLMPGSNALNLLENLRNEAHRTAISFHKKLRNKNTFKSKLDNIPGVGLKRRTKLLSFYGSSKEIAKKTPNDLHVDCGVPLKVAISIINYLK